MGSDESHFNVSLIVGGSLKQDSVHRPQLLKRKDSRSGFANRGSSAYQPNALPLGQTGSPLSVAFISGHAPSVPCIDTKRNWERMGSQSIDDKVFMFDHTLRLYASL